MNIKRIVLLASMALTAIAFAAPPAAQAEATLTENSKPLQPGAGVTMTSTNLQITTALGLTLTCQLVTLHYEIDTNDDTHVVLQPVGENMTTQNCHVVTPPGITDTVHMSGGTNKLTINTWGTGSTSAVFSSNITGLANCTYTGTVSFQATGGSGMKVGPSALASGLCGAATIHGNATLETPDGKPLTLDYVSTG